MDKQTNGSLKWFHPDVPKSVRSHLMGENHSPRHKFAFGMAIIYMGVSIVKGSHTIDSNIVQFLVEGFGHIFGGIGAIPVIKSIDRGGNL